MTAASDRCAECGAPLLGLDCETSRRVSTGFGLNNVVFPTFCDVGCEGAYFGEDPVLLKSQQTKLFEWAEEMIESLYGVDQGGVPEPHPTPDASDTRCRILDMEAGDR